MRKYYTRPCNFYYGDQARDLIKSRKALSLAGRTDIAFDQIEILERQYKKKTKSKFCSIKEIEKLNKNLLSIVNRDLRNITSKREKIYKLDFNKPAIMGVLNVTPDSFSDGGFYYTKNKAIKHIKAMVSEGADIIDVGGESTRPGSKIIKPDVEWKRVKNIVINFKKKFPKTILSLDTRKSYVIEKGIKNGVDIINDVSGLNFDKNSFNIINSVKKPFILHHMQGTPQTMQINPKYKDAALDIFDFFELKIKFFSKKKYNKKLIVVDPGIGFGKNLKHNLRIMSKISIFHSLGCPVLIGTSKKRFIEHIVTKLDTKNRVGGTLSSVLYGLSQGVQLFRVHDVKEINQGILVFNKIINSN